MKELKTNWVFDKVTYGEDVYDMTLNVSEQPTELGLNGGRILTLIIKKNDNPFYIYDKGNVELDSNGSESILKIACDNYNHNKTADYYLNKLLDPKTGVTGLHIEIATSINGSLKKIVDIHHDLLKLINASIDYSKLKADNLIALITLDYNGTQYLMYTEEENDISVYAMRDIPEYKEPY